MMLLLYKKPIKTQFETKLFPNVSVQLFSHVSFEIAFLSVKFCISFPLEMSVAFKAFTENLILGSEKKESHRSKSLG